MPDSFNPLKRETLVAHLAGLGVGSCTPVMVHASLRKTGPIDGGADTLIDALIEAQGRDGTLVMPLGSEDGDVFDALTSRAEAEIGVLAEVFRQREGVRVNDHPAARFAARGPLAAELLEPIPLNDYYGPGSPLSRFALLGGWVLRLGANVDTVTLTHWAEYLADVPGKRRVRRRYVRADTGEQWIESLDDSQGITDWPHGDYFSQILVDFLAAGHARSGRVGNCNAELFPAQPFVDFAVQWMEKNLA